MTCEVVNVCQGRNLDEEEVTYSERLAMGVEPRSIPKRFNNSRKEKETMTVSRSYQYHILSGNNEKRYPHTSGTPDLDKVPKLRINHSDKGNQTNNTQC